ncbi:dienelactone hydrolase family protein [Pseudohyphozyma bogoriensis]|nr:dienelactone hydrolase family protein [Pseudohyphozyma bogoriensis]
MRLNAARSQDSSKAELRGFDPSAITSTRCDVTLPKGSYDKTKALLFLPNVFGLELISAQLLADSFAANGFATYIPDYLNGDAIPHDAIPVDGYNDFDLPGWFARHEQDVTRPPLDAVINGLRESGVTEFAATGYCFGGEPMLRA